jgi:hypothetical protein
MTRFLIVMLSALPLVDCGCAWNRTAKLEGGKKEVTTSVLMFGIGWAFLDVDDFEATIETHPAGTKKSVVVEEE